MNFNEELNNRVIYINETISRYLPAAAGMQSTVIEAMDYSVLAGGKRLRPMIMAETFKMCGGSSEVIEPFMAAIEMIHTYSLVHDDLPAMDNDDYRRGKLTTHKKFGEDIGILAGDGLLNFAYETMLKAFLFCETEKEMLHVVAASKLLSEKAGIYGMVGGQTLDVELTDKLMNKEQMDFIFRLKTGALLEASFAIGAMLAGADEKDVKTLLDVGIKVGLAFQIQDDILDITSTQEVLGKPVLSDEKNNKTTYVTLYGMEKASEDVERLSKEAIELLKTVGSNEYLEKLILKLINREK